jgi:4,5-DOPA dioxygenase extradiol
MMTRRKVLAGGAAIAALSSLSRLSEGADAPMPTVFIGYGSPMNTLEDNEFTAEWRKVGAAMPKPSAILCVSAHWETPAPMVLTADPPETIHDFGGFPRELHEFQYPAPPGAPDMARETAGAVGSQTVGLSDEWGLDHGTWSVLAHLFPDADVPVYQLSLGQALSGPAHLALGRDLAVLRRKGVLIVGSGNVVHNLPVLIGDMRSGKEPVLHDWAAAFDDRVVRLIEARDFERLADLEDAGPLLRLAHPTLEHYLPLLYVLGAGGPEADVDFFAEGIVGGSLSMRAVLMTG